MKADVDASHGSGLSFSVVPKQHRSAAAAAHGGAIGAGSQTPDHSSGSKAAGVPHSDKEKPTMPSDGVSSSPPVPAQAAAQLISRPNRPQQQKRQVPRLKIDQDQDKNQA